MPKLLFASWHSLIDPSSGAAISARELLQLLAPRGWDCRIFCGPALDFEPGESLPQLLANGHIAVETRPSPPDLPPFSHHHFQDGPVASTIYAPAALQKPSAPTRDEALPFLALFERLLDRERPDLFLTYGGQWLVREMIDRARSRNIPVVFWLRNFAYRGAALFENVNAILVPSQFSRNHYHKALGLDCTVIPSPINWDRIRCEPDPTRRFVTFVNPQPSKGVYVFARIALELGRLRPDIPLLVAEGRGRAKDSLERTGADLSHITNLHRMANTPNPRDFYRVTRLMLMPSLWNESFGRVAAESLINGIPVLATRRGALAETLASTGYLFDVPSRYTPESRLLPTPEEVSPWIESITQFWDDATLYEHQRNRCLAAAQAWHPERLARRYDESLQALLTRK